jgi:hypothetical protein
MRFGSNAQMREFFRRQKMENSAVQAKYTSKAAEVYRTTLAEAIEKGWHMDVPPPRRKPTPGEGARGGGGRALEPARQQPPQPKVETTLFEVAVAGEESIGVSIEKDKKGLAKVFR